MSTIFADKFKNTSGGNPVQINQLRGIDTAGSITVLMITIGLLDI